MAGKKQTLRAKKSSIFSSTKLFSTIRPSLNKKKNFKAEK
jgi:hypothetical protein